MVESSTLDFGRPMLIRALLFVLPALLLLGCSSTNVSNREPLADYVGRTVTLNRPMALIKEGRGIMAWSHLPRLRKSPYVMLDTDASEKAFLHPYPTDTNVIVLAVGYAVTIDTVHDEIAGIDPVHTTVYGRVILPGADAPVRFAFAWGDTVRLFPAPWESTYCVSPCKGKADRGICTRQNDAAINSCVNRIDARDLVMNGVNCNRVADGQNDHVCVRRIRM